MARSLLVLWVTVALVAVVVLGVIATQIGGVAIRSASRTHTLGTLTTSNSTLLPGVPLTVRIDGEVAVQAPVAVQLRLPGASRIVRGVSPQELAARVFVVTLPCDVTANDEGSAVRLVLINLGSQAVLAQSGQLALLPAGPDCVR